MADIQQGALIDWAVPGGRHDWLLGTGADRRERALVGVAAAAAVAVLVVAARHEQVRWEWWQWLLAAVLAVDVAGGVPANALATAKRFYHSPGPPGRSAAERVLRSHVGFSALHVHPFVAAAALPDAGLAWAAAWYAVSLAGTAAVVAVPLYLRRPLAAAVVAVAVIGAPLAGSPAGLAWLGPLLTIKLVAAHAVREEPYRPAPAPETP